MLTRNPPYWIWALILLSVAAMVPELFHDVRGDHFFRQTQTAANIELMVEHGVFTVPRTYNEDAFLGFFDLPLYQVSAAFLCKATGWSAAFSGRIVNLLVHTLTLLFLERLLRRCRLGEGERFLALFLFAAAPLVQFYGVGVLPDPLALLLSVVMVERFLAWHAGSGGVGAYVAALLAGIAGAMIKSPVVLPAVLGLVAWAGWRRLLRPGPVGLGMALVAAVLAHRLLGNALNEGFPGWSDADAEFAWYFSSLQDRATWKPYDTILQVLGKRLLGVATWVPAAVGLVAIWRRPSPESRLLLGWLAGCFLAALLFFNLHMRHNYYQLVFAPPLAAMAAVGSVRLWRRLYVDRLRTPWRLLIPVAFLVVVALFSWKYTLRLRRDRTVKERAVGAWIQQHTRRDDKVLYVLRRYDWNPAFLYYARRMGRNLHVSDLARHAVPGCVVFLPTGIDWEHTGARITALVSANRHGTIVRVVK